MEMKNPVTRLGIVVALVALLTLGTYFVRAGMKPPKVEFPAKGLEEMPMQFGAWRGEDVALDPEIFESIGADSAMNRVYRDAAGAAVSLHVAIFGDPDVGVFHSPINCYRSAGWQKVKDNTLQIQVAEQTSISGNLTAWEREGKQVVVLYWYQIGEHVLFDRFELGGVRWAMRGRDTWPAMNKVLMQTAASDNPEQDKAHLRSLAEQVYRWINEPAPQAAGDNPAD